MSKEEFDANFVTSNIFKPGTNPFSLEHSHTNFSAIRGSDGKFALVTTSMTEYDLSRSYQTWYGLVISKVRCSAHLTCPSRIARAIGYGLQPSGLACPRALITSARTQRPLPPFPKGLSCGHRLQDDPP